MIFLSVGILEAFCCGAVYYTIDCVDEKLKEGKGDQGTSH